jgi:hypothetical protein
MLLHILAANCSHLEGATSVEDMYSMLCKLPNLIAKIFIHVRVIP